MTKHTKPPYRSYGDFPKFSAIHMDFVGPLPVNKGKRFLVTIFDRATRWFAAYPVQDATTDSAVKGLLSWVSDHGIPDILVTDRGSHFESQLFRETTTQLGIEKRRTKAYHPASNGAVERQHRRLKEAIKAKCTSAQKEWLRALPLILLGLRNSVCKDTNCSAAQAVYGRTLNIPGCVFENESSSWPTMNPKRNPERSNSFVPKELEQCEHVWIKKPTLGSTLSRPYMGPFKVLNRNLKYNTIDIDIKGKRETVALERVKPAFGILTVSSDGTYKAQALKNTARTITFAASPHII